jgi:hypothetical protein
VHAVVHCGPGKVFRPHARDIAANLQFDVSIRNEVSISCSAWSTGSETVLETGFEDIIGLAIPEFTPSRSPLNPSAYSTGIAPMYEKIQFWDSTDLGQGNNFDEVRFLVVNGPQFPVLARLIGKNKGTRRSVFSGRLIVTNFPWEVTLDQEPDSKTPARQYRISHYGLLRRTDHRTFGHKKAQQVLLQLMAGLTFMGGLRCGLLLPVGMQNGQSRTLRLSTPRVDPLNLRQRSWYTEHIATREIETLLGNTMALNPKIPDNEVVRMALEYANQALLAPIDAGLAHAIAGLEYLCDAADLPPIEGSPNGAKRIGALADFYNLPGTMKSISALQRQATKRKFRPQRNWSRKTRLIAYVVWARNQHMHGKIANRHLLPQRMWQEAWILSNEWLSIVLLKKLNYSGQYWSRLGKLPKPAYKLSDLPK